MNGIPRDVDLTFLENKLLMQICVGWNELILNFESEISLTIHSSLEYQAAGENAKFYDTPRDSVQSLICSLNQKSVNVRWTMDGSLTIIFENDNIMTIYDHEKFYESYTISNGTDIIVV